jgi:hypothetical protein
MTTQTFNLEPNDPKLDLEKLMNSNRKSFLDKQRLKKTTNKIVNRIETGIRKSNTQKT